MSRSEHQTIREAAAENQFLTGESLGVSVEALSRMAADGVVVRLAPGVYIGADVPLTGLSDAAAWCVRFPRAAICGLTAAIHHDLTDAFARGEWLAVEKGTTVPRSTVFPLQTLQVAPHLLNTDEPNNDIGLVKVHGLEARLFGPDRSAVDLWRLGQRFSSEYALVALKRRVAQEGFSVPRFSQVARQLKAWNSIRPVLQGMML